MNEVGIIGAGPAGLSCALWLKNLAFSPNLIERAAIPAEVVARHVHPNNWLLGFGNIPGGEIRDRMVSHITQQGISIFTETNVTCITHHDGRFLLETSQHKLSMDYLVIASGAHPACPFDLHQLATKFPSKIQVGPESQNYLALREETVAIMGGGDNAFEHAILLAGQSNHVGIFCRGAPRARSDFLTEARTHPNITIHADCVASNFEATEKFVSFRANNMQKRVDYLMVMYGFTPNTQWLPYAAPWMECILNDSGFVHADSQQRTKLPFVYAAGDVTNFQTPCIPVALAQGAVAAKSIESDNRARHA